MARAGDESWCGRKSCQGTAGIPGRSHFGHRKRIIGVGGRSTCRGATGRQRDDLYRRDKSRPETCGERPQSGYWIGITRFRILTKPPPDGYMWTGERLTKIQTTSRPDGHLAASMVERVTNHSQEKQDSNGTKKPKMDAARRLRGFTYIASDDPEFATVIKNARGNLETQMETATPCEAQRNSEIRRSIILRQPAE